jgi:hypothetical protein
MVFDTVVSVGLLWNAQKLVRLKTQAPEGMFETITNGQLAVPLAIRTIQGLEKKVAEREMLKPLRFRPKLRIDEFQFVTFMQE